MEEIKFERETANKIREAFDEDIEACYNLCVELARSGTTFQKSYATAMLEWLYVHNFSGTVIHNDYAILPEVCYAYPVAKFLRDPIFEKYNIHIQNPTKAI